MISIILTSKHEPRTVGKAIKCLIDREYSGLSGDFELITVVTDKETEEAIRQTVHKFKAVKWNNLKDNSEGKPAALNKAFKVAKGDILLLTDGDVFFEKNAIKFLIDRITSDNNIGGVCGRPLTTQSNKSFWGYTGHMFLAAADKKRNEASKKGKSFAMSGYIMAIKNFHLVIPDKVFDDMYISYEIMNKGYKIAYEPEAKVYIKQPTNLKDWISQKVRNITGQQDLNLPEVKNNETRSFLDELRFASFTFTYPGNPKQFLWSLLNFPLRLYIWLLVWKTKYINKKSSTEIWKRVDSTK